ncbi:hypothetical protein HYS50_00605 [Candidatus Woesearchaeota archaeon]|nr:hypothetical protein [Candidatus Woesearchaeota archaeon]
MPSRKKRLKKGIVSLEEQIRLHEQKLQQAEQEGKLELVGYYRKEIEAKRKDKEKKEQLLKK